MNDTITQANNELLMRRLAEMEEKFTTLQSLLALRNEANPLADSTRGQLPEKERMAAILAGVGKPVHVPDRGLAYPKYLPHPTRKMADGNPQFVIVVGPFEEGETLRRFEREGHADLAKAQKEAEEAELDAAEFEVRPKRRSRKAAGAKV